MVKDMDLVKQNIINATRILANPDNETFYLVWGDTHEIYIYITNEDKSDISFYDKGTFEKQYPKDILEQFKVADSIIEKNKLFKKLESHEFYFS